MAIPIVHPIGARTALMAVARPPLLPLLGLLGLSLIWGLSIPLTKLGLREFPPLLLATLRYVTAAPFFALFLIGRPLPSRRALLAMIGLGVLGIGVGQVTQILGVQRTEASVATIISATIPIFVVLLAGWRLRQRLRIVHGLGLALALAGVAIAVEGGGDSSSAASLSGDVLMLVSAVSIALYYVLSAELTQHYPVITVAAWSSLAGVAVLAPFVPWEIGGTEPPRLLGIGIVLYLGVLVTVAGVWVWLHTLRMLPARIAAGTQYLQPLIGVAAAAWLLGDPIGGSFGVGTVLVLVGIALSTLPRSLRQ
ncbi:MAG TPA: DMT family transporter [Acetobacteraceae bacterium]